ncbi:unnamed protein product [Anisakis simplex]|uniref:MFS domain-containing protein n=1 Tax=Anisakis simplex TaxID=6269 RepID=A0A0M3JU36_ANISI|nr:unnamed protein product [Anisakis simplex]
MASRKEKERLKLIILLIYGLFNTFNKWTRVLLPFMQWRLQPRPTLFQLLLLNSFGSCIVLLGSFFIAQLVSSNSIGTLIRNIDGLTVNLEHCFTSIKIKLQIDSRGCRFAAIFVTILAGTFELIVPYIKDFYLFGVAQILLIGNHLPMVVDAMTAQLIGEDGDDKERTNLIMQLTIPESIAYAVGPYLAIQFLYIINASIETSQTFCGFAHLVIVLPIIYWSIPGKKGGNRSYLPSLGSYKEMLHDSKLRWSLLFLLMVAAPFSAYDQVIRTKLASHIIFEPTDMAKMAFLLGLTTMIGNLFVLPLLQARMGPKALLQLSMLLLSASFLYLSQTDSYASILLGMPFQVIGVCIAFGQLSSQIMGNVGHANLGKAAALNRGTQVAATLLTPLFSGYYIDGDEARILCYLSAFINAAGMIIVHFYGTFMRHHVHKLPLRTHDD